MNKVYEWAVKELECIGRELGIMLISTRLWLLQGQQLHTLLQSLARPQRRKHKIPHQSASEQIDMKQNQKEKGAG